MASYSLLQLSLDQSIDRASLEDASVVARSVSRADCAKLQRELFGIVVSGLAVDEALAFQAELARRGFPTELAEDDEVPGLHAPYTVQRIAVNGRVLGFTDAMGRTQQRPLSDLVFLAGGFSTRRMFKTKERPRLEIDDNGIRIGTEKETREQDSGEFRLDFFFTTAPHRLQARLSESNALFYQDKPLRMRLRDGLLEMMAELRALLPPERTNAGLKRTNAEPAYPNAESYEEEIRWHFHRLIPKS